MTEYKIVHNRPECIGCGACVATCEKYFEMDENDNKSNLKGGKKSGDKYELEIEENDSECVIEAAENCPVNIIHVTDLDSGEEKI